MRKREKINIMVDKRLNHCLNVHPVQTIKEP